MILDWPSYLTMERCQTTRNLHAKAILQLVMSPETGTFRDPASKLFYSLPNDIKLKTNAKTFARKVFKLFKTKVESRLDCICLIVFFFVRLNYCF